MAKDQSGAALRMSLFALGFAAGGALWLLAEIWDQSGLPPLLYLALFSFVAVFSGLALGLAGPLPIRRALVGGLPLAVLVAGLLCLAAQRFDMATDVLDHPEHLAVLAILVVIATPFQLVWLQSQAHWSSYPRLFSATWEMVIRYLAGWMFVSLFWLLAFLSDAVLSLVDVGIIEWVIETEWMVFALSGGVLGLALAVADELRDYMSPVLMLRLLRLLVIPVLAVVTVFLIAIPIKGLSDVFGALSTAATLLSMAVLMVFLVSSTVGRAADDMPSGKVLLAATRLLAALSLVVSGIAAWAIVLRVVQYGWTPDRVFAASIALVVVLYSVLYAVAVFAAGWERRIRQGNVYLALLSMGTCVALMTPVIDPWRIASNSQVQRYLDGKTDLADVPFWELGKKWGRAGEVALERLIAEAPQDQKEKASSYADAMRQASSIWAFESWEETGILPDNSGLRPAPNPKEVPIEELRHELVSIMPVRPAGKTISEGDLGHLDSSDLQRWLRACRQPLPSDDPGCVLVIGDFFVDDSFLGVLVFLDPDTGFTSEEIVGISKTVTPLERSPRVDILIGGADSQEGVLEKILDGEFTLKSVSYLTLDVAGKRIVPFQDSRTD